MFAIMRTALIAFFAAAALLLQQVEARPFRLFPPSASRGPVPSQYSDRSGSVTYLGGPEAVFFDFIPGMNQYESVRNNVLVVKAPEKQLREPKQDYPFPGQRHFGLPSLPGAQLGALPEVWV